MKLFSSNFENNRRKYLTKNGLEYKKLISAKLEHGSNIKVIESLANRKIIEHCDGLLTSNPDLTLSVTVADCLPVFLFDQENPAIGVLHCGWRSISKGIIENCLTKMRENFSSNPKNILIGIGPGIQECHFEVQDEFINNFKDYGEFVLERSGQKFVDLKGAVVKKLLNQGLLRENIEIDARCTVCDKDFWSYRRDGLDKNKNVQAMIALMKLSR